MTITMMVLMMMMMMMTTITKKNNGNNNNDMIIKYNQNSNDNFLWGILIVLVASTEPQECNFRYPGHKDLLHFARK